MLVAQIAQDTYSHLYASFQSWGYAPNPMDAFFLDWLDAQAMIHHQKGKVRPTPAKRPWEVAAKKHTVPQYDPKRAERRRSLQERLGLRSVGVVDADDEPDGQPESQGED